MTPLDLSQASSATENADWLSIFKQIETGVPITAFQSRSGLTALGRAVVDRNISIIRRLIEHGFDPHPFQMHNQTWYSPLWAALERGYEDVAVLLLELGADPNGQKDISESPLCFASQQKMAQATCSLCAHGADPNNNIRPSPLLTWILNLAPQSPTDWPLFDPIFCLLDAGANPEICDDQGRDAPTLARDLWSGYFGERGFIGAEMAIVAMEEIILRKTGGENPIDQRLLKRI